MFELAAIKAAHSKVKSGADFPNYINEIHALGVQRFETWATDSHTIYFGENNFEVQAPAAFPPFNIADQCHLNQFQERLKLHQQGQTDYVTFCADCAANGIEKWVMDLNAKTCSYFDKANNVQLVEMLP